MPVTFTGLTVANHTFRAVTVDPAGNQSAQVSRTWTVRADTVPPDTTITAAPPAAQQPRPALLSSSRANEASTFQCSVNGGPFTACASPAILSALADGAITFQVRAVDLAENIDPTPATAAWTRDTAPPAQPALFIGRRARAAQKATRITAVFHTTTQLRAVWDRAPDAATSEVEYRVAPGGTDPQLGDWTPLQTPPDATQTNVTIPTGRSGCVRARSVDAVGNASAWTIRCTTVPYKASSASRHPPVPRAPGPAPLRRPVRQLRRLGDGARLPAAAAHARGHRGGGQARGARGHDLPALREREGRRHG